MCEMTTRQREYLLFFAQRDGKNASIAAAAQAFHVAKPSVTQVANTLEKLGLLQKDRQGEITLTQEGKEEIVPLYEKQQEVREWMVMGLGVPSVRADGESRRLVVQLDQDTVERIVRQWQAARAFMKEYGRTAPVQGGRRREWGLGI